MEPFVSRDNAMGLRSFAGPYLISTGFLEPWGRPRRTLQTLGTASSGPLRMQRPSSGIGLPLSAALPTAFHHRQPNEELNLTALDSVAAGSLRSPAALL